MDEQHKYRDPIISIFQDEKNNLDNEKIHSIINQQTKNSDDIQKCEKILKVYKDLLKLEFFMNKSWDIKTLTKSVLVKFELSTSDGETDSKNDESFYKDIALKCIKNCDKFSIRLQNFQNDVDAIRAYIVQMQTRVLTDSITLLLELWFTCNKKLTFLKNKVAGIFIRSKLLLIDHELESLKFHLSDTSIITSYRSFMKILVEQLQDSEVSLEQSLFDECLHVFLDIEAMYNSLNFSWLLSENKSLHDSLLSQSTLEQNNDTLEELDSPSPLSMDTFDDHLQSSSLSTSTDLSLMMERTNLSKELPSLLAAFNNAKKLEQELESLRTAPPTNIQTTNSILTHHQPILPSENLFKSKLMMMDQQQQMLNHFGSSVNNKKPFGRNTNILNNLQGSNARNLGG